METTPTPRRRPHAITRDGRVGFAHDHRAVTVGWLDVDWPHPATPVAVFGGVTHEVAAWGLGDAELDLALDAAVRAARQDRRAALVACTDCGRRLEPGHVTTVDGADDTADRAACHDCAAGRHGIVF